MRPYIKQSVLNAACMAWIDYRVTYAGTAMGVLWPALSSTAFILILGFFFNQVMGSDLAVFLPHIAWGYAIWGFISNALSSASNLFRIQKAAFLAGHTQLIDIVMRTTARSSIDFFFQSIPAIIITIVLYRHIDLQFLWVLPAVVLILLHAFWVKIVFGVVCARFADVAQLIPIGLRIGFLVTPIIWMPGSNRDEILGAFLLLNPFYHVLEPLRDALLSQEPELTSYAISFCFALVGCVLALSIYRRFSRQAILWV